MSTERPTDEDATGRARAWQHAAHAAVCDLIHPWSHGTVVRATRYPSYYDYNVVRVEQDPASDVRELSCFADEALAGLPHRRLDFEHLGSAERLRADFERQGWLAMRLVWMRHELTTPPASNDHVDEVPYDAVHALRVAWHLEDFPETDASGYHLQSREVALRRGARVLAMQEGGAPVAFAQIERQGSAAEIAQVYVDPAHRGRGRGTAITRAAIASAGDAEDLWICADDEGRPKQLYARLGFRPAWRTMEFLRLP